MGIRCLVTSCVAILVTTGSLSGDAVFTDTKLVATVRAAQELAARGQLHAAVQMLESTPELDGGSTDTRTVAIAWNELGKLYTDIGRLVEARKALSRSMDLFRRVCAAGCADIESPLTNLARVYTAQRDFTRSERVLEQVLAARSARLGAFDPALASLYAKLANVHWSRRNRGDAEGYARAALRALEGAADGQAVHMASARNILALVREESGDTRGAMEELRQAILIVEAKMAADHPELVPYLLNLGSLHMRLREWRAAEMELARALAIVEAKVGDQHPRRAETLMLLGRLYRQTGRGEDAKRTRKLAEGITAGYRRQESLDGLISIDDLARAR
ncbi:MAG TPA: tetratricopeptide repeat protein [Bryobacteraceae bacterium]|nr:tetratricopeptide repeat protein [Bryobacteraceae bacterium]